LRLAILNDSPLKGVLGNWSSGIKGASLKSSSDALMLIFWKEATVVFGLWASGIDAGVGEGLEGDSSFTAVVEFLAC